MSNFGDLIKYLQQYVLEKATEDIEADDLTIHFYENEITFQVNEIYDGLIYTYDKVANDIKVSIPEDRGDQYLTVDEVDQASIFAAVLNSHKNILKELC